MTNKRMILLEFNELCPSLLDRFIGAGQLPAFERLHRESVIYTTRAKERAPQLDPWIQWVTVHTGLNYDRHRIDKLNQGETCDAARIWDVVSAHGGSVWICGSMSTSYRPGLRGALVPDPWTTKVSPTPGWLLPYFQFVQQRVVESTNQQATMPPREALRFARFMIAHGLSLESARAAGKQLLAERLGRDRWKRPVLLDQLQFDVFSRHWRRHRPTFSTLFLNSTAHFQHLHWREMEPHLFRVQPATADLDAYQSAIPFGYQKMDVILARVLEMIDAETTLVLASALSQQPCLSYEDQGGKAFYKPRDFSRLFAFARVRGYTHVAPVMAHQFHVEFESPEAARVARERLQELQVSDRRALAVEQNGRQLFAWCPITTAIDANARLVNVDGTHVAANFFSLFFKVDGLKSGMHHPDGVLWFRRPSMAHARFEQPVDLDRVAPTLLTELGVAIPASMRQDPLALGTPPGVHPKASVDEQHPQSDLRLRSA